MVDQRVLVGVAVSLSGRYAVQGRLAAAGLQQAVADVRSTGGVRLGDRRVLPELVVVDDGGTHAGVVRALDALAGVDVWVGPYGSDLVRAAAARAGEHGRVLWNHGGSADDVERLPGVVSVASPASRYLAAILDAVARRRPSARVLVAAGRGGFGHHAMEGAKQAAVRLGMSVVGCVPDDVPEDPETDVLLLAGSLDQDLALLRRLRTRPPVIGAVAGGLHAFADAVDRRADGVLAPTQWEEGVRFPVGVGPHTAAVLRALRARVVPTLRAGPGSGHVEYPSAQAYAVVLIALHCARQAGCLDDQLLMAEARRLRCTTFFGRFGLAEDGHQRDHDMLVAQWRAGIKRIVWPPSLAETELDLSTA